MTQYGWDTSDYDWGRGVPGHNMNIAAARSAGIALLTGKVTEGTSFHAQHFDETMARAVAAKMPVLGAYHVLYPAGMASIDAQLNWYFQNLNADFPGWKTHPCFIHQIDAEWFQNMTRAPSVGEINQFGLGIEARGVPRSKVVTYAPEWLYGGNLVGLRHKLWASGYVGGGNYKAIYPGDSNSRWDPYSGITPMILQYSSTSTIGTQPTCDANAIKVSSEAALVALFHGDGEDMTPDQAAVLNHIQELIQDIVNNGSTQGNIYLSTLEKHLTAVSQNVNAMAANVGDVETATNMLKTQNAALTAQVAKLQQTVDAMEPGTGGTAPSYNATFQMTPTP